LIKKYLPLLATGKAPRIPQNEEEATYFKKRTLEDNEIRIETDSPDEIYRKIHAFSKPYNGAFIRLGNKKLIIWKAELRDLHDE
jgi:UDP-4-amino-4-deoxy-L-arabinose formyltransferase/UDP-glucuronic acid dehydrogenase (UDP-4-keto-hexauronic acid decarboxylating)